MEPVVFVACLPSIFSSLSILLFSRKCAKVACECFLYPAVYLGMLLIYYCRRARNHQPSGVLCLRLAVHDSLTLMVRQPLPVWPFLLCRMHSHKHRNGLTP